MYKLTAKQERIFWNAVTEYIARLRVIDWTVRKKVVDCDDEDSDTLATCTPDFENRTTTVTLCREWGREPTEENLREIAFHEDMHIVMAELMDLATDRFTTEKQLEDAEHEVIRRIISFVFRKGMTSE